jgi:hypothetical protein
MVYSVGEEQTMHALPDDIAMILAIFAPVFTQRAFAYAKVLMIGAILAPGRRTVSAALRIMGLGNDPHFQNYHRVLNRGVWSSRRACGAAHAAAPRSMAPTRAALVTEQLREAHDHVLGQPRRAGMRHEHRLHRRRHVQRRGCATWVCSSISSGSG